jgi:hypothetical protein
MGVGYNGLIASSHRRLANTLPILRLWGLDESSHRGSFNFLFSSRDEPVGPFGKKQQALGKIGEDWRRQSH